MAICKIIFFIFLISKSKRHLPSTLARSQKYKNKKLIFNIFRMKKAVPEVRMTEAARKRSAKIRQNKETAENKPGSPKFAPRARVKPLSGSRTGTLEKKATGNSMSNIEPKKAQSMK